MILYTYRRQETEDVRLETGVWRQEAKNELIFLYSVIEVKSCFGL